MNKKSKHIFLGFLFIIVIFMSITAISATDTNSTTTTKKQDTTTTIDQDAKIPIKTEIKEKTQDSNKEIKKVEKKKTNTKTTTQKQVESKKDTIETRDNIPTKNNKSLKQEETGTFSELQTTIEYSTDTLTLNKNYVRQLSENTITISKTITIDGQGYTINANKQEGIFKISGQNVILKNMIIANSNGQSAITIEKDASLTQDNITATNNTASYGGVNTNYGTLTINNSTFTNNLAEYGGVNSNHGTLTINNATFTNNKANKNGGVNNNTGILTINNSIFTNNTANTGGVNNNWMGNLTITEGNYINNSATHYGGINQNNGNLTINNATFINNKAYEGGINYNLANLTINNGNYINNSATSYGGTNVNTATLIITDGIYTKNTATEYGGTNVNTGTLIITNGIYTDNTAPWGGVNVNIGTLIITNGIYTDNTATANGGVNYNYNGKLTINNGTYTNNNAKQYGGINFNVGKLTINNGTYTNNNATNGGVNYNYKSNITINNGTYTNNNATDGGVNYNNEGNITINNSTFTNNIAKSSGGVIYNTAHSNLTITNGTFTNNTASTYGEVVYNLKNANLTVTGGNYTNNNGYVFYSTGDYFEVVNSSFINNTCDGKLFNVKPDVISGNTYIGNNLTATMNINPKTITTRDPTTITITITPDDMYNTTINTGYITLSDDISTNNTGDIRDNKTTTEYTTHLGQYTLIFNYLDDTNSFKITNPTTINIDIQAETEIKYDIKNSTLGNTTVEFSVVDTYTKDNVPNSEITITLQNKTEIKTTTDDTGIAKVTFTDLPLGSNTITVIYKGNDTHQSCEIKPEIIVTQRESKTEATITNNTVGKVTVQATVTDKTTEDVITSGTVTVKDADDNVVGTGEVDANGIATIETNINTKRTYTLTVTYNGNENYTSSNTKLENIEVVGKKSQVDVEVTNDILSETKVKITVTDPETSNPISNGKVEIKLPNGTIVEGTTTTDGTIELPITIPVGSNDITVTYTGDNTYNSSSKQVTVNVKQRESNTEAKITNNTAGNVTIEAKITDKKTGAVITSGTVTITENSEEIGSGEVDANGVATIKTDISTKGEHTLEVKFTGNINYTSSSITLEKQDIIGKKSQVTVDIINNIKGNTIIKVTVTDSENGKTIPNADVEVKLPNGTKVTTQTKDDGTVELLIDLPGGLNTITTTYLGNINYAESDIFTSLVVYVIPTISSENITTRINDTTTITINVNDEKGNPINGGQVILKIKGKTLRDSEGNIIYTDVKNGKANIETSFNLKIGTYPLTVAYGGYSYYKATKTTNTTLTITPRDVNLTFEYVKPAVIGSEVSFKVKVTDENKLVNTGRIIIKLNGRTLRDANGNIIYTTVENGIANVKFTIPTTFKEKTYQLTAVFGDKSYNRAEISTQLEVINPIKSLSIMDIDLINDDVKLNTLTNDVMLSRDTNCDDC